jgi:uncharacterized membrane-anchored protein YitT (DUF2179 family)
MNFSKGFLLLFQLLSVVFQIILIGSIPDINKTYYYIFVASTVITYLFGSYTTYHIKFHSDKTKDESSDESEDE